MASSTVRRGWSGYYRAQNRVSTGRSLQKLSAASQRQNSANTRTGVTASVISTLNSATEKVSPSLLGLLGGTQETTVLIVALCVVVLWAGFVQHAVTAVAISEIQHAKSASKSRELVLLRNNILLVFPENLLLGLFWRY
jgi:hypothetical protein